MTTLNLGTRILDGRLRGADGKLGKIRGGQEEDTV